ncbi:hypothetical protein AMTR_s00039p00080900 [Amborella trichopoda]|uniref:Glycosyltransferase N-terminal domain-containing protein n=1 Tax=Amborella trichopoda TaxID=13333 RepID=U5D5X9_AMBTC|nr:hypothetical protein AMTR_s00039p00080900 [Amborella trichopoda]
MINQLKPTLSSSSTMSGPPNLNFAFRPRGPKSGGASGAAAGAEPPKPAAHLRLREFPTLPPDPESSNKFPAHLQPVFDAIEHLLAPLTVLVRDLASVVVIHDMGRSVAAGAAAESPNSEAYMYRCPSACFSLCFQSEGEGRPEPIPPGLPPPSFQNCVSESFMDFLQRTGRIQHLDRGVLHNTFHALEGQFLSKISQRSLGLHVWAVGRTLLLREEPQEPHKFHECLQWLSKQAPQSVLYISFGTCVSMCAAEVRKLAPRIGSQREALHLGAKTRRQREHIRRRRCGRSSGATRRVRGEGAREGVDGEGLGIPIGDTASPLYRWNSCMESISMGVPIVEWPMHSDQPANAQLVAGVLGVGVGVKEWHEREDIVRAERVEKAVRKLMGSGEGAEMKRKAAELRDAARRAVGKGGTSRAALDSFLAHISRPWSILPDSCP